MIDAGEVCDDGDNPGLAVGDCAPDCSAVVELRLIALGNVGGSPKLISALKMGMGGTFIDRIDATCPPGYKALFAYGNERVASLTPFAGDGQVDWALRPWTRYELGSGVWLGTTDGAALLGVRGGTWEGLKAPITEMSTFVWTGMNTSYTTIADPDEVCDDWSNAGFSALAGNASLPALMGGKNFLYDSVQSCILARPFICADQ